MKPIDELKMALIEARDAINAVRDCTDEPVEIPMGLYNDLVEASLNADVVLSKIGQG